MTLQCQARGCKHVKVILKICKHSFETNQGTSLRLPQICCCCMNFSKFVSERATRDVLLKWRGQKDTQPNVRKDPLFSAVAQGWVIFWTGWAVAGVDEQKKNWKWAPACFWTLTVLSTLLKGKWMKCSYFNDWHTNDNLSTSLGCQIKIRNRPHKGPWP